MTDREVPVLIVGGSLAGLTAGAFLGLHGVRSLVVERHRGTAIHPRAAMLYQRTMEILRSLGIEEVVRHRSYEQFEPDGAIMSVETLAGEELNWDIAELNKAVRDLSPTERMFVPRPRPDLPRRRRGACDAALRPDGFVAWRAETGDGESGTALGDALSSVLARDTAAASSAPG